MNYYERHLGDYARDTAHLSLIEHGVYTLLLDRYYATEQPIPEDQAHRVARARSREEKAAVDAVLDEFFTLLDGAYHNRRCDEEIDKLQARFEAKRENGKKGGRPKKNAGSDNRTETQEKPTGFDSDNRTETETKAHQAPSTIQKQKQVLGTLTDLEGRALDPPHDPPPDDDPPPPDATAAGRACLAMRRGGLTRTNPADPRLLAAIAEGATDAMWQATAAEAAGHDPPKPVAWVIATVRGRIADAARTPQASTGAPHGPHRQQPRLSAVDSVVANIQRARQLDQQHGGDTWGDLGDAAPGEALPVTR